MTKKYPFVWIISIMIPNHKWNYIFLFHLCRGHCEPEQSLSLTSLKTFALFSLSLVLVFPHSSLLLEPRFLDPCSRIPSLLTPIFSWRPGSLIFFFFFHSLSFTPLFSNQQITSLLLPPQLFTLSPQWAFSHELAQNCRNEKLGEFWWVYYGQIALFLT